MSPGGSEVIFGIGGDTKSSVDGAEWKDWPASVTGAFAWRVAWCGTRSLALFQHGEYDADRPGRFIGAEKRSLRIRDGSGEWKPVPLPENKWPVFLGSTGEGSVAWLIAK